MNINPPNNSNYNSQYNFLNQSFNSLFLEDLNQPSNPCDQTQSLNKSFLSFEDLDFDQPPKTQPSDQNPFFNESFNFLSIEKNPNSPSKVPKNDSYNPLNMSFNSFMESLNQPSEAPTSNQNLLNMSFSSFLESLDRPSEIQKEKNDLLNTSFDFFSIENNDPFTEQQPPFYEQTLSNSENKVNNFFLNATFSFQYLNFSLNRPVNENANSNFHNLPFASPLANNPCRTVIDLTRLESSNEQLSVFPLLKIFEDLHVERIEEQKLEKKDLDIKAKRKKETTDSASNKKPKNQKSANSIFNGSLESNFYLNRKPWTKNENPPPIKKSAPVKKNTSLKNEELEEAPFIIEDHIFEFENVDEDILFNQLFHTSTPTNLNHLEKSAQNIIPINQQKNLQLLPPPKRSDTQKIKENAGSKEKKTKKKRVVTEIISYKKQKRKIEKKLRPALNEIYELNKKYAEIKIKFENSIYPKKPKGMERELMPYQWRGYQWMKVFFKHGIGGCLADEMGLGKTIQSIALIQTVTNRLKKQNKSAKILIACPGILVDNWINEISTCCPELKPKINNEKGEITIVSHSNLRANLPEKKEGEAVFPFNQKWDIVIIDECHMLLNGKPSKQAVELLRKKSSGPNRGFFV